MRIIIIYLSLIIGVFGKSPIIKVEGTDILKALAYTENNPYTPMYDWDIGNAGMSPIIWDPDGNNWSPEGFERKGKVYLSNNGQITHTIVDKDTKPGYWTLFLLGDKDKIIKATLSPNKQTLENPSILIDKAFLKEHIVCEKNSELKYSVYRVKFPQKLSFWMEEKQTFSTKGNKYTYVVDFGKKPECANKSTINKKDNSNTISQSKGEQIKLFIEKFYKAGEENSPSKALPFYASKVDRYFSITNANKEDILTDKIRYYEKWPIRNYKLEDFGIIDTYISNGIQYYSLTTSVAWNSISKKGKSVSGTSYNIITVVESEIGYLVKSIKVLGGSTQKVDRYSRQSTSSPSKTIKNINHTNDNFSPNNNWSKGIVKGLDSRGDGYLSIRSKPKGKEIGRLYNGDNVFVIKQRGLWYKVKSINSGKVGWSHSKWIRILNTSTSSVRGIVKGLDPYGDGFLSIRNKPKGRQIGKLYNGDTVQILSSKGKWLKIRDKSSGQLGWVHSNWIRKR